VQIDREAPGLKKIAPGLKKVSGRVEETVLLGRELYPEAGNV
jgi:hypothetical protein